MPFEMDNKFNNLNMNVNTKLSLVIIDSKVRQELKKQFGLERDVAIRFNENNEIVLVIPEQKDTVKDEILIYLKQLCEEYKLKNYFLQEI